MTAHLSNEQMARWIAGEREAGSENHVGACAACRAELACFEATLMQFQRSVRQWSGESYDQAIERPVFTRTSAPSFVLPKLAWASALLAICLMANFLIRRGEKHPAAAVEADAALMNQLDQEVSRTVPGPMEPLMKLVSWDGKTETSGRGE